MPQATNNLEPICGKVAVTGDRTRPLSGINKKGEKSINKQILTLIDL